VSGAAATRHVPVPGIDARAVSGWIATLGLCEAPPLRFARVGSGQSNLTFLVTDTRGRHWILRRPPLGHLLASAHDVVREHRVLQALEQTGVPTPAVYGLCEDNAVCDVPLVLMEHVDGLVVEDMAIAESLAPALRAAIGSSLATTLAAIHSVDLEETGLDSLSTHAPYAARQLKRWRRQWEQSRSRELPIVEHLAERLENAMPAPGEVTLVHGDFHLLNVIASPLDGSVKAVLDWELCTLGDPLADLGGLLAYWPQPGDAAEALFPAPALPGFPTRSELCAAYAEATGRSLDHVGFWHVLGLWKLAIIADGVVRRAIDEPLNTPSGAMITAKTVDDILVRAQAIAKEVGL
jgi:aminoglycoside phosphotransferase (APT) family kinase protein